MTEDKFQHIIWAPRVEEIYDEMHSKEDEIRKTDKNYIASFALEDDFNKLGLAGFLEKHTDGPLPFTNGDVTWSYDRYMQHARLTDEMFETKQIDCAWVRVLTQLPHVELLNVGIWDFDGHLSEDWRESGCEIRTHRHSYETPGHEPSVCRQLHEPIGEALFRAAMASLVAARSPISHLEIKCVLNNSFTWADDGTLDGLDLGQLQSLSFDPVEANWRESRHWTEGYKRTAAARCGFALGTLVHKCSSRLGELNFAPGHNGEYLVWPPATPNQLPILPSLDSFKTGTNLDLSRFARFISQSPSLSYVQLICCGGFYPWREVWKAIRDHPNRMIIDFEGLSCNEYGEFSVSCHTGQASEAFFNEDPWENLQNSLENYLSRRRHWDKTLHMWFEGEGSDDEDDGETESENEVSIVHSTEIRY